MYIYNVYYSETQKEADATTLSLIHFLGSLLYDIGTQIDMQNMLGWGVRNFRGLH